MKNSVRKRILSMECKKLLCNPLFFIVLVTFFLINVLVVQTAYGSSEDQKSVQKMYQVLKENKKEEAYADYKKAYGNLYQDLNMLEIMKKKEQMGDYRPTGNYQKFIENNYKKLQKHVDELKVSVASRADYYPGLVYKVHSTLFGKLGKNLLTEVVILALLSVLYLMDYDRVQKTWDQVLVTESGKRVMGLKMAAGIFGAILYSSLLMIVSYGYFVWKLPLRGLMHVPVSACMVAEARNSMVYPFVTFWNLSIGQYLVLNIIVFFVRCYSDGNSRSSRMVSYKKWLSGISGPVYFTDGVGTAGVLPYRDIFGSLVGTSKSRNIMDHLRRMVYGK